jgi:hypothetical protein
MNMMTLKDIFKCMMMMLMMMMVHSFNLFATLKI